MRADSGWWDHYGPSVMVAFSDLLIVSVTVFLAGRLRSNLPWFAEVGDVDELVSLTGIPIVIGWLTLILLNGGYAEHHLGAGAGEYKRVLRASLFLAGGIGIVCYLARFQFSRGFYFLLFIIGIPLLILGRYVVRRLLHTMRRQGSFAHYVLLSGSVAQVDEVASVLERESWLGYKIVGALVPGSGEPGVTPGGVNIVGSTSSTLEAVLRVNCDSVLFAGGSVSSAHQMRRAVWELNGFPVNIMLVPSLTDIASDRVRVKPAAGLQLMEIEGPRAHRASRMSKRLFDVVGAAGLILIFSPILIFTALSIRLNDNGPIIFRQRRVGLRGEQFSCLKFRSMVVGADSMVETVSNMHDDNHVLFKNAEDPRVTRPGRVIRRFSLDEMPQLFNVLRGDMSLVGPRPSLPEEVERYSEDVRQRLAVRPGMTGLWQVSGRSDLSWEDSVRLDLYYVDNWSLVQDLAILGKTLGAVVSGRGAY